MVPGCVPFKIVSDSPTLHSRWLLFFKRMIISLWNLLQYHSIVRWAIQAQWAEPLVIEKTYVALHKVLLTCTIITLYKIYIKYSIFFYSFPYETNACSDLRFCFPPLNLVSFLSFLFYFVFIFFPQLLLLQCLIFLFFLSFIYLSFLFFFLFLVLTSS